jgi:polysaccharide deacetylase family protein (PEP-CTERM system associated)
MTRTTMTGIANALSVDVEEYYHAAVFCQGTRHERAVPRVSRVEGSVDRLIDLFGRHRARATFFVLGEVAARCPGMIRRIAAQGHEVACHGHDHSSVTAHTAATFRADVRSAKARIEEALGAPVIGYRAPNFSIGRAQQAWAYDVLLEEGFQYDSSSYPILHDRYGDRHAPRFPYDIWTNGTRRLVEFPIGTAGVMGVNLPIGGGGFFRVLPAAWVRRGFERVNSREQKPVMFYLHPWEIDPDQPRAPMPWPHRFRHYVGLARLAQKLGTLLADFSFRPAREVLCLT